MPHWFVQMGYVGMEGWAGWRGEKDYLAGSLPTSPTPSGDETVTCEMTHVCVSKQEVAIGLTVILWPGPAWL